MSQPEKISVGLVGAVGRGGTFRTAFELNGARIHAVCDVNEDALDECMHRMGAGEKYTDYDEMLEKSRLDAVVIGTPMQFHVPQSIAALEHGLHVLAEVPAGVSVEECRDLVLACRKSDALYMMAENYTYIRPNVFVRELSRAGLFGDPYYAEGEYLHELKELNEVTVWRRKWQTGIEGVTYGTHSLGPILQWMPGDRVVRVCCEGSAHHYTDPRGDPYHQESAVMLCKTAKDALVKIRLDMLSDRPHAMTNYQLQGTDGCYESSRNGPCDRGKIWLRALSDEPRWFDLETVMNTRGFGHRYMPECWVHPPEAARRAGHGGGDYFEVADFLQAVRGEIECPIGIDEAMDMTLPGLISQQSILQGGRWTDVPDSRRWTGGPQRSGQLQMLWPERLLDSPPEPPVPAGYQLRCYTPSDEASCLAVLHAAGFTDWSPDTMHSFELRVLPDGWFVVEHKAGGRVVATAFATHNPSAEHPSAAELGYVAGDPGHKGKGLGLVVCAAVVRRCLQAGYRCIFLLTDDWRLPALKTYLKLGFEPLYHAPDMQDRWQAILKQLNWPA
jgi:predicted dehydrogenase/GNAT superfamily N-acetyltransferase